MQFSNKGRDKVLAALKGLDGLPYPFHTQVLNQFIRRRRSAGAARPHPPELGAGRLPQPRRRRFSAGLPDACRRRRGPIRPVGQRPAALPAGIRTARGPATTPHPGGRLAAGAVLAGPGNGRGKGVCEGGEDVASPVNPLYYFNIEMAISLIS